MALLSSNAAVAADQGMGATHYLYAVTIATITVEAAVAAITTTYGGTVVGINSTTDATCYVMVEGGPGGAEATGGIALTATFAH